MNNPYVEETLIREFMMDVQRRAARQHMLHGLEPARRVAGPGWTGRMLRALWRPRPAGTERGLVTR